MVYLIGIALVFLVVAILIYMQRDLLVDMACELKKNSTVYEQSIQNIEPTEAEKLIDVINKKQDMNLST
jgi:hypothetical protein